MEKPKTKILIAIDEPNLAKTIVHTTYSLINRKNSEITLLNVNESNVAEENLFYSKPEKFIEHEAEKTDFVFLEDFLENSDADYKGFIYGEGEAAHTIMKLTKKEGYDLIVIGSHNKNPLERLLLGSVAYKVTRAAKCSVLVINAKHHLDTSIETNKQPFSILMGVDMSDDSFCSAEHLWKFVDKERANVTLLHATIEPSLIIPPDAYIYIDMPKIMEESNKVS